jgi:hypothetical protein
LLKYYTHRFGSDALHLETDDAADEPFNKSRAINLAVSRFPGHVSVITDADVYICDWTLVNRSGWLRSESCSTCLTTAFAG